MYVVDEKLSKSNLVNEFFFYLNFNDYFYVVKKNVGNNASYF